MQIRDKFITSACLIPDGIEWTTLKLKQDGNETVEQSCLPCPATEPGEEPGDMASLQLSDEVRERLSGDLTVSIRTSELLMRTMEFPTTDPDEIENMVGFQIDKASPFPLDQLAVSHEIIRKTENNALVLMVAAKHKCIDAIGDLFAHKGVHIHSIDARILGWLSLLEKGGHLTGNGSEILIVDDGIDYAMAVLSDGAPVTFRSLPVPENEEALADELASEISYTLTTLDSEHDLPAPTAIDFWNLSELSASVVSALRSKTGLAVRQNRLSSLPPLSEGIIERTLHKKSRIELIPREWVEHERKQRLKKRFLIGASAIGAVWLTILLIFTMIYQTRAMALRRVQEEEASLAPLADQAIENRKKLKALKRYADRSDSALECLREVTDLLPAGDIEFVSYNYDKNKGVRLRGTAETDDIVYDYFDSLADSKLFVRLKDQRINTKVTKGLQRAVFSANLMLPSEEEKR